MANRLCTIQFMRVCFANLLLFISLYMLLPISPLEMSDRLGLSIGDTGKMFLMLTAGMVLVGPFHAYMVDAFKRKRVCILSFLGMVAATVAYNFVHTFPQLLALCAIQGVLVGLGTMAGVTLAIDITTTTLRSYGNITFSWMVRLGMLIGAALGVWLYQWYSYQLLLFVSVITGIVGIFALLRVYVPFRAPIMTCLCSTDRFVLKRGWLPAINLAFIAFVPGLLLPVFHHSSCKVFIFGIDLPFFAFVVLGFPLALILYRLFFKEDKFLIAITLGLSLMFLSIMLLSVAPSFIPPILLGLGLGLVAPEFLMIFVKLSQHCQRATANMTHFMAWQIGITCGIALACHLQANAEVSNLCFWARVTTIVSLLFFVLITYPYFKKMRVR